MLSADARLARRPWTPDPCVVGAPFPTPPLKHTTMKTRFTFSTRDSNANDRYWDVFLDGRLLKGCRATGEGGPFTMFVDSLESWDRLKAIPCDEFRHFEEIFTPVPAICAPFVNVARVKLFANASLGLDRVVVQLSIDAGEWRNPWSINAFLGSMESAVASSDSGHQWKRSEGSSRYGLDFDFITPVTEPRSSLGDVVGTTTTIVRAMVNSLFAQLQGTSSVQFSAGIIPDPQVVSLPEGAHHHRGTRLPPPRSLVVFLCHASEDKESAHDLYSRLLQDGFDPWLDEVNLLPGQDWGAEIPRAVRGADVVVVCLSKRSIDKTGYVQREIRTALDAADERPAGSIFMIPARIENCQVPERLSRWQRVDLYAENGYERLLRALDSVRISKL